MSHRQFGRLLKDAMRAQGVQVADLVESLGVDHSTIVDWRAGARLPRIVNAARLADELMAPSLVEYVAKQRTMECEDCGRAFIYDNRGGRKRQYCSQRCARASWGRRKSAENKERWGHVHTRWQVKFERAQKAVDRMCDLCVDWEGVCRTPECPLRPVSPLPLIKEGT